jgi:Arc/MetJ family transcription regulator
MSVTVDEELLANARRALAGLPDSAIIDRALAALLRQNHAAKLDAAYALYEKHPLGEADTWGDLASFREAAARS